MKKFFKWSFIILFIISSLALSVLGLYVASIYLGAQAIELNEEILASPSLSVAIYNDENKPIKEDNEISRAYVKIDNLNDYTKNAFISIEDKTFYQHHGVNYKRILKASLSNLKAGSFKEGASTITQQLVKNTQLTSEKTFTRKIKEVALAQKLEKKYDKDKILELYLNVIYFGNNCYGIESAANYYFSKEAKDLSIEESALLAGMIKSPAKYSPIKNKTNALSRRNLVLDQMKQDGKITTAEHNLAKSKPISLSLSKERTNRLNSYAQASLDEAEEILGIPARQIAINGYKLYTYQNDEKQSALEKSFSSQELNCDYAGIVIENDGCKVSAYIGDSNFKILDAKRQPGSCIKPILVYAPALNEDLIYPCSQLLDEKITVGDYSPKNVGNVYHGYVSAREALSKSINIPAIKVLSYVGIEKAKAYGEDMGIEFDENDNSYTLALGGMSYGSNIASIAGAYSTFARGGSYVKPSFISYITDKNGKLVYTNKQTARKVLRDDCAYLLTDMLKTCAQSGTARKLVDLPVEIASKTGTVGKSGSKENLDAWNVSYTQAQTCAVWLGNLDNTPISYAGGNQPTAIVKDYFLQIEDDSHFKKPSSVVQKDVDCTELNENHRVMLASPYMPERYTQGEIFSNFNLPEVSTKFTKLENPNFTSYVSGNHAIIEFDAKNYVTYQIKDSSKVLKEVSGLDGRQSISIPLSSSEKTLFIQSFYTLAPDINTVKEIKFVKKEPRVKDKWYI
ncbi:MAG: transglycosylase domain-containing protein [Clostridia bacterium]|nr:transglycosylase domain-containing protein [Clostridia bacterium]